MVKALMLLSGVAAVAAAAAPTVDLVDLASSVPALSTLVTAVVAGDLATTLKSEGPFTVFAPTNDAFGALPAGTVDALLKPENKAQLVEILKYHVLPVQVTAGGLRGQQEVKTVEGKPLIVTCQEQFQFPELEASDFRCDTNSVFVGSDLGNLKHVTAVDNLATNGVAHIIDGVMLPPAGGGGGGPGYEHAQCGGKGFKGFTICYEGLECIKQNDFYSQCMKSPAIAAVAAAAVPTVDLVDLASSVPSLSTLVTAVVAGDLATTLKSDGPFTVFAPTNDAFGALPPGTVDTLLKPENKAQLVDILTYHVLPSQVLSSDLIWEQTVKTVEGKPLMILCQELRLPGLEASNWRCSKQSVLVGSDRKNLKHVQNVDNLATNGVAHIIDGVMLPPADPGHEYAQCGGIGFKGLTICYEGLECIKQDDFYSSCMRRPAVAEIQV